MTRLIPEIFCIIGLSLVARGLWMAWQPLAYLAVGGVLATYGVWRTMLRIKAPNRGDRR